MEWVETTGRTIEAALDAALDELGVDEHDVEYEVLQEPKTGLFGRLGGSRGAGSGAGEADLAGEAGGAPAPEPARRKPAGPDRTPARSGGDTACRRGSARGPAPHRAVAISLAPALRQRRASGRRATETTQPKSGQTPNSPPSASASRPAGIQNRGQQWKQLSTMCRSRSKRRPPKTSLEGLVDAFDLGAAGELGHRRRSCAGRGDRRQPRSPGRPAGSDAHRDRRAGPHGRAAPDRRSRRAHPRRRRRATGRSGARRSRSSPARSRRRWSRPAGRSGSSRCRRRTARSCTTPRPRSTVWPRSRRAKTLAAGWCSAPSDRPE